MPGEGIKDEEIMELRDFKNIRSLLLGENQLGNEGVTFIIKNLTGVTKLQLNGNKF